MVNLLLACTGSVASVKVPLLVTLFYQRAKEDGVPLQIKVVATEPSLHFFSAQDTVLTNHNVTVLRDAAEYSTWTKMGDDVLHIELRKWADVMVVAPLSANTLAKAVQGMCDNLLTCVMRAWDFGGIMQAAKPMFVAPAMNTAMWMHPVTAQQLATLRQWGITVIDPISKTLACGDTGIGAMAESTQIVALVSPTLLQCHQKHQQGLLQLANVANP